MNANTKKNIKTYGIPIGAAVLAGALTFGIMKYAAKDQQSTTPVDPVAVTAPLQPNYNGTSNNVHSAVSQFNTNEGAIFVINGSYHNGNIYSDEVAKTVLAKDTSNLGGIELMLNDSTSLKVR